MRPAKKPKVSIESCKTCRFFKDSDGKAGLCKENSPKAVIDEEGDELRAVSFYFPVVPINEWCGKYKPNEWSIN
jgi:hypothetical protein